MVFKQYDLYLNIIKKYKITFILLFLLSLFFPLRSVVLPKIILNLLSDLKIPSLFWKSLWSFIIIFSIIYIGMNTYDMILIKLVKINIKSDILNIFYKKIFKGLENNYAEIPGPNIFSNIFYFGTTGNVIFSYFFSTIFPYVITFLGVGLYLIYKKYLIEGISFIIINILLFIYPLIYSNDLINYTNNVVKHRNNIEKGIFDIFWNIYNVFSCNKQEDELKNIDEMTDNLKKLSNKQWNCCFKYLIFGRIVMVCFICLIIYTFFKKYKVNKLSLKQLTSLVLILVFVTYHFFWTYYIYNGLLIELYQQDKILKEINISIQLKTKKNKMIIKTSNEYFLQIKNVDFTYLNKNKIFSKLNLNFEYSKSYAIIGKIGCGKSSLLKILFGIYYPEKGDIIINNHIHRNLTKNKHWRKYFNYLQQSPILFGRNIEDNLYYNGNKDTINKYIKEMELEPIFKKLKSERKNQKLEKLGEGISGGQKQIINFLRILGNPKPIILMDEPTSSLDLHTKKIFYKMFMKLKTLNKLIIVVTHDSNLEKLCNHKLNLSSIN